MTIEEEENLQYQRENKKIEADFKEGLDFLLSQFPEPLFPRKISTLATEGGQFIIYRKQEILHAASKANYIDCRINAYPVYTEYKGINRQAPNIIFIDIDRNDFQSDLEHEQALRDTLGNIRKEFGVHQQPTIIWSGNGYHVILPIYMPILEQIDKYNKFTNPSENFLRYAEIKLSNGKADADHNPSFKSCMLRIPGSLNSKCLVAADKDAQVRIIQKWNGGKSGTPNEHFMTGYRIHLRKQKLMEIQHQRKTERYLRKNKWRYGNSRIIPWMETLLETPIEDYRKHAVDLILAPYLMLVHQLTYDEAFRIIEAWLDKCNTVRRLDFNPKDRIKTALKNASRNNIPPMGIDRLKQRNPQLYKIISEANHNDYIQCEQVSGNLS